jgi:iron complex outermembrane recepter protein
MPQLPTNKIAPMAAAVTAALCSNSPVFAQSDGEQALLEEVIVTARKRTESVQDIPVSIQSLSENDLKEMGARGLADYSRFVPSVNVVSYGNGSSTLVFRGANVNAGGYVVQGTSSMYLDEISVTATGSQPSIRMVDIARVEALSGPQGTLYGSDAQAGTLRVITNKPVMNEFGAVVDAQIRGMEEGEDSYDGSVVLNLPLIDDKLALRVVGFKAKDGGYIDNVLGHTPDVGLGNYTDLPSGWGTLDNSHAVEDDWNDSEVEGWRASLLWQINDDWSATASYLHQNTESGAYSDFDPNVGDLETIRFNDEFRNDEYDLYSLTIEGDLGFAQLISATGYFEREIEQTLDNTVYAHYWAAYYCRVLEGVDPAVYYWYYELPEGGTAGWRDLSYCGATTVEGDFLTAYDYPQTVERFTQEFRLSAQGETLDWLVGLYYEKTDEYWQADFAYPTINGSTPGETANPWGQSVSKGFNEWRYGLEDDRLVNGKEWWYSENTPEWEQFAVFGEATWHATEKLDVTLGLRYFDRSNEFVYKVYHPDVCPECPDSAVENGGGDDQEFVPKIAVAYSFTDDIMGYALATQGYRPGGTNRARGAPTFPIAYEGDKMTSYEIGVKSMMADGAVRFNATAYYMDWEDYQLELTDPSRVACPDGGPDEIDGVCGQPWQTVVANAGEASITGVEAELDWAITSNLLFGMNMTWLDAQNGTDVDTDGSGTPNVSDGDRLPVSPEWAGSAWAQYNWDISRINGGGFARLQWSYTGDSVSNLEPNTPATHPGNPQFKNESYNIGDFHIGISGPTWETSLFVTNLTDERAHYNHSWGIYEAGQGSAQDDRAFVDRLYTSRPREVGFRVIKRWGG